MRRLDAIPFILLALAHHLHAQCPPVLLPGNGLTGVGRIVRAATVWDPDCLGPQVPRLVAGGDLNVAGSANVQRIAAWDGSEWRPLGAGLGEAGGVSALVPYACLLVAGGSFVMDTGAPANFIAAFDGAAWRPLGSGPDGPVEALAVFNGQLIAAGVFTQAGGQPAAGIARWDGSDWHPLGAGLGTLDPHFPVQPTSLAANDNWLYVGGYFDTAGGASAPGFAAWNGSAWSTSLPAPPVGTVYAIATHAGQLYAGGVGGFQVASSVARWSGPGWTPLGAIGGAVFSLGFFDDELIAGGTFQTADGVSARAIARWNGAAWSPLSTGFASPSWNGPSALAIAQYGPELFVGGDFAVAGAAPADHIARWDNLHWRAVGSGNGANDAISDLTPYNGRVVAVGSFTATGPIRANRIASWDGAAWSTFGTGMNGAVNAVHAYGGDLIAAGQFTTAGGVPANNIARWNGATWSPLGSGITSFSDARVGCLAVYNGELVAGGSFFFQADGGTAFAIARWDQTQWRMLGGGLERAPSALAVFNGDLYATGVFEHAGGVAARGIARWDGAAWHPLGSGLAGGSPVAGFDLAVYNGRLLVAGMFETAGGVASPRIAAWDGQSWHAFPAGGPNVPIQAISSLAVHNGELIAGGVFNSIGGVAANRLARFDGAAWHPLAGGLDDDPPSEPSVAALLPAGNDLYIGGGFRSIDGVVSVNWARLRSCYANCDCSTAPPALNVLDFNCFISRFTAGSPAANCDSSTAIPTLNVLDFACFLNRFTAGCP